MILDELDLQLTLRCNLDCDFCSVDAGSWQEPDMSTGEISRLIRDAAGMGMKELHFTGGEPTLRPDLLDLIRLAKDCGLRTRIITNGTLLDRQKLLMLKDAGLENLMVSIDGPQPVHDRMRGMEGAYASALQTVRDSLELGLGSRISAVAFRNNLPQIPELMETAAGMGVHTFSVFLGSPLGRAKGIQELILDPDEWRQFLVRLSGDVQRGHYGEQMNILAEQGACWPGDTGYEPSNLSGRGAGCRTLTTKFDYLLVRADGEVFQCVFFMHEGKSLGNVRREPLKEILDRTVRQHPYERFTIPGEGCETCEKVSSCGGGCRGYSRLVRGDWHKPDPRCSDGTRAFFPVCPIAKLNLRTGRVGGSTEHALAMEKETE